MLKLASEASHGREDLLDRIERALGLVNETVKGSAVCPECGGPKSAYATRCIKHNAGAIGNPGGPGGDRSSPAAITAGVGKPREAQSVIDTRALSPEQRGELATVLAHGKGTDVARVVKLHHDGVPIAEPKRRGRPPKNPGWASGGGAMPTALRGMDLCPECEVYKKPIKDARCASCDNRHARNGSSNRVAIGSPNAAFNGATG